MDAAGNSDGGIRGHGLRSLFRRRRNDPGRQTAGASIPRAAAPSPRDGPPGHSRRRAMRSFWPGEDGGSALETAVAIALAVAALAGLMEIVNGAFESDRMHRAARAAAQATALDPNADACAAIRGELRLADEFDCTAWTITVHKGVLPSTLAGVLGGAAHAGTGDMVLVRVDWSRAAWPFANLLPAANAAAHPGSGSRVAIGFARSEPLD